MGWIDEFCRTWYVKCPSYVEIKDAYRAEADKREGSLSVERFCAQFYDDLMKLITHEIGNAVHTQEELGENHELEKKRFSTHTSCLEALVPFIDSPYYSREEIMINYMQHMMNMKARGSEWEERLATLKSQAEF